MIPKGTRVKFSALALERLWITEAERVKWRDKVGTVVGQSRDKTCSYVRLDDQVQRGVLKQGTCYSNNFLEIMDKEIEIEPQPVPLEITIKYKHPSTSETVTKRVLTDDYIPAKIKQLGEFGYPGLTDKSIRDQLYALRNGYEFGKGLDAIGMMLKDEVIFDLV